MGCPMLSSPLKAYYACCLRSFRAHSKCSHKVASTIATLSGSMAPKTPQKRAEVSPDSAKLTPPLPLKSPSAQARVRNS